MLKEWYAVKRLLKTGRLWMPVLFFSFLTAFAFMLALSLGKEGSGNTGRLLVRITEKLAVEGNIQKLLSHITIARLAVTFGVSAVLCTLGIAYVFGKIKIPARMDIFACAAAAVLLVLCVVFELNGTSLYMWKSYLSGAEEYAPLFGIPRAVRGDEWAAWSVFTLSQEYENWPEINRLIADGDISTQWISVGGIPALSLAAVFKPLYWGFFVLGSAKGLSLLWSLRTILLFFVSYAFAHIYTGKNRRLSFAAAVMLTLAPYVQWWFSQSIAEVLIFGQGMLICLHCYLNARSGAKKITASVILAYCLGCYMMIGYLSWLISTLFVIVPTAVVMICKERSRLCVRDIPRLALPTVAAAALIAVIVLTSADTLSAVAHSVYPGSRVMTGGNVLSKPEYFTGLYSLLLPFENVSISNHSELSCFITFAPAGLVTAVCAMISRKKKDALLITIIAVEALCGFFLLIGVSEFTAKLTLLSQCSRMQTAIALADIILLMRGLSLFGGMNRTAAGIGAALCTVVCLLPTVRRFEMPIVVIVFIAAIYAVIFCLIFASSDKAAAGRRLLVFALTCVMICAGAFVNPVQKGTGCVTQTQMVKLLTSIDDGGDALYAVEGAYPQTNIPLLAGKKCFTATQVYPDVERWKVIDPDGEYEDIYNRFCHIAFNITWEDTFFTLRYADSIQLDLALGDMEKFGIDYLLTQKQYGEYEACAFELISTVDGWNIYKVTYKEMAAS